MSPLPNDSVVLEASAGTGKTWIISALFVRLVAERDLRVDQILTVTFTRAATAELRDRVRTRLRSALDLLRAGTRGEDPVADHLATIPEAPARLERALAEYDEAAISTIHGFCQQVLDRYGFECGVDLNVTAGADSAGLLKELVRDFWATTVFDMEPELYWHLRDKPSVDIKLLVHLAERWYRDPKVRVEPAAGARPDLHRWRAALSAVRGAWQTDRAVLEAWLPNMKADYKNLWERDIDEAAATLAAPPMVGTALHKARSPLRLFLAPRVFDETYKKHQQLAPVDLPLLRAVEELMEADKAVHDAVHFWKIRIKRDLLTFVAQRAAEERRRSLETSYDDLLREVRAALESDDDAARNALKNQYKAALIDEFQDTDPVQWGAFRQFLLGAGVPVFLVGDPKQAIYEFRGADIHSYLQARDKVASIASLDRNFRTDAPLVQAVNRLFETWPDPFASQHIQFEPVIARHVDPRARWTTAPEGARLRFLYAPRGQGELQLTEGARLVSRHTAADIRRFLSRGHRLAADGGGRDVGPGDCAVLTRTNDEASSVYDELHRLGIPAVQDADGSVLKSPVAAELLALLRAMADPADPWIVRAALVTTLAGGDADRLGQLSADDELWAAEADRWRGWQSLWLNRGLGAAIQRVLETTRATERLLRQPGGVRLATDLRHLAEQLQAESHQRRLRPQAMVAWFDLLLKSPADVPDERWSQRLETDANAVKVLTVHRAKGLEFPFVWCPFLWRSFGLWGHDEKHLLVHDPDPPYGTVLDVAADPARLRAAKGEKEAEERRVLYVALTRAAHLCTAVWACTIATRFSPLGQRVHGGRAKLNDRSDEGLLGDLERLAIECGPSVSAEYVSHTAPPPLDRDPPVPLAAGTYRRPSLDTHYRRASFTEIARGKHTLEDDDEDSEDGRDRDDGSGPDEHDQDNDFPGLDDGFDPAEQYTGAADSGPAGALAHGAALPGGIDGAVDTPAVPLVGFPAGKGPGNCIHAILENIDYGAEVEAWRAEVGLQLTRHGIATNEWTEPLTAALMTALRVDLGGGFSLSDLPREATVREMAFDFACPAVPGRSVTMKMVEAELLPYVDAASPLTRGYAHHVGGMGSQRMRGFMTGFIDLVFQRDGRFYLADWKSNWLGESVDAYGHKGLSNAIVNGNYVVQYLVYSVALHRYLKMRQPGYSYDAHFGGCYYFFLRGMVGPGPETGVFFTRPPARLVESLSTLFREGK